MIVNNLASEPRLVNSRVPSVVHEPGSAREPCLPVDDALSAVYPHLGRIVAFFDEGVDLEKVEKFEIF